jgi:hypothetical protein
MYIEKTVKTEKITAVTIQTTGMGIDFRPILASAEVLIGTKKLSMIRITPARLRKIIGGGSWSPFTGAAKIQTRPIKVRRMPREAIIRRIFNPFSFGSDDLAMKFFSCFYDCGLFYPGLYKEQYITTKHDFFKRFGKGKKIIPSPPISIMGIPIILSAPGL